MIKRLFPDSYYTAENGKLGKQETIGARTSKRQKKLSTRWTEEAGYLAPPPISTKKKSASSGTQSPEGTDFSF